MQIIENIVPKTYQNEVEGFLLGGNFPWYLTSGTVNENDTRACLVDNKSLDTQQFVHLFHDMNGNRSGQFAYVMPFVVMLEDKLGRSFANRLLRVKANMMPKMADFPIGFYNPPHIDWGGEDPSVQTETMLYYVCDSDGDTVLFNEKLPTDTVNVKQRMTPKKGTAILFDSTYLHCSTPPRLSNRCVINFVFRKEAENNT